MIYKIFIFSCITFTVSFRGKITIVMIEPFICVYIDIDDSKLESCSFMVKGVHLLLGEPSDFGFSFVMDIFHKVNYHAKFLKLNWIV